LQDLAGQRRAIRGLLDERSPQEAMAVYYAFVHEEAKTQVITWPLERMGGNTAVGFITLSRTGLDLFRPFLTMRLPLPDLEASAQLLQHALPPVPKLL
jgi:hypothetical protein